MNQPSLLALSDLHLGRSGSRLRSPEALLPLLEGFEHIYLLGDIVDRWYLSPDFSQELETRLRAVCRRAGARQVLWFRGNHDANTQDGEEFRFQEGVLYFHGHALYHRLEGPGSAHERIRHLNARKFGWPREACRQNKRIWASIEVAYNRIPQRWASPLAWNALARRRLVRLASEVARGQKIRAAVFGHTHCPGAKRVGSLMAYNLGGWMQNTHACGFVRHGDIGRLMRIENRGKEFRWDELWHETALDDHGKMPRAV